LDRCPISFFIQDLREGGAERSVARLLSGIVARGIATDLVVIEKSGPYFAELDSRVNVVELSQSRTLSSIFGLKRYLEEVRPKALVSAMVHTNVAATIANRLSRFRTRLVVVEHNLISKNRMLKSGFVGLSYRLVPWCYPIADSIAAVSDDVRDDLAAETGIDADRIIALHNPVVTPALRGLAAELVDHPWFQAGSPPVVLGVGRLSPQKNFPLLIQSFAEVRRNREAKLVILGEGELRPELEQLVRKLGIESDVDLPGFDANPFRFMSRAAVYVLSSDWEGLPTALIEALACGAPVVSTDCAGTGEILADGEYGKIVPRGDAVALARAIEAALDARGDVEARMERANEFGLERAVDRYLEAARCS
jgi:glycosyltransferase involved in cell wall biosynthesis